MEEGRAKCLCLKFLRPSPPLLPTTSSAQWHLFLPLSFSSEEERKGRAPKRREGEEGESNNLGTTKIFFPRLLFLLFISSRFLLLLFPPSPFQPDHPARCQGKKERHQKPRWRETLAGLKAGRLLRKSLPFLSFFPSPHLFNFIPRSKKKCAMRMITLALVFPREKRRRVVNWEMGRGKGGGKGLRWRTCVSDPPPSSPSVWQVD